MGGAEALVQGDLGRHIRSGLLRSPGFFFSSDIQKIFISVQLDINGFAAFCVVLESPVYFPLTGGAFHRHIDRTKELFSLSYFQTALVRAFRRLIEEMEDLDMAA